MYIDVYCYDILISCFNFIPNLYLKINKLLLKRTKKRPRSVQLKMSITILNEVGTYQRTGNFTIFDVGTYCVKKKIEHLRKQKC